MSIEDTALNRSGDSLVKKSVEKNGIGESGTPNLHQLIAAKMAKIRFRFSVPIGFARGFGRAADSLGSHGTHEDQRELLEREEFARKFINSSLQMEITVSRSVISSGMLLFTIETFDCDLSEKYGLWAQFTAPYNEEDEDVFWDRADFSPLMSSLDKLRTRRIFEMNIIPETSFDVRAIGISVSEMERKGWFPVSETYTAQYFKNENGSAWLTPSGRVFARAVSEKSNVGMEGARHMLKVRGDNYKTDSYIDVTKIASDPIRAFAKISKLFRFKMVSHD